MPNSTTRAVELGRAADFVRLPARIDVVDSAYFLTRDDDGWRLLSAVCPHTGGDIADDGDVFRCPNHSWAFDRSAGSPVRPALWPMSRYDVEERGGVLVAHVESDGWSGVRARQRREETDRRRGRSSSRGAREEEQGEQFRREEAENPQETDVLRGTETAADSWTPTPPP